MKKILIVIMLLFSTATMAQRLSVLGIEMGTGIDEVERRLSQRFGEYEVYRTGNVELCCYDKKVGGVNFDHILFEFQNEQREREIISYLSSVVLSSHFTSQTSAEEFFFYWHDKLWTKYGGVIDNNLREIFGESYTERGDEPKKEAIVESVENGKKALCAGYGSPGRAIISTMEYGPSKGGDYFWFVTINFITNFIDESNDY